MTVGAVLYSCGFFLNCNALRYVFIGCKGWNLCRWRRDQLPSDKFYGQYPLFKYFLLLSLASSFDVKLSRVCRYKKSPFYLLLHLRSDDWFLRYCLIQEVRVFWMVRRSTFVSVLQPLAFVRHAFMLAFSFFLCAGLFFGSGGGALHRIPARWCRVWF